MPKAILEFTLPEEESQYTSAIHAERVQRDLRDLDQELRSFIKYDTPLQPEIGSAIEPSESAKNMAIVVRSRLAAIIQEDI